MVDMKKGVSLFIEDPLRFIYFMYSRGEELAIPSWQKRLLKELMRKEKMRMDAAIPHDKALTAGPPVTCAKCFREFFGQRRRAQKRLHEKKCQGVVLGREDS